MTYQLSTLSSCFFISSHAFLRSKTNGLPFYLINVQYFPTLSLAQNFVPSMSLTYLNLLFYFLSCSIFSLELSLFEFDLLSLTLFFDLLHYVFHVFQVAYFKLLFRQKVILYLLEPGFLGMYYCICLI